MCGQLLAARRGMLEARRGPAVRLACLACLAWLACLACLACLVCLAASKNQIIKSSVPNKFSHTQ